MLGKNNISSVPNQGFTPYLATQGSTPGPLFISESGEPLTRTQFKALLSATLKKAGLDDSKYNTHSFQIRAAMSAKAVGISDMHIQLLRQWRSSAYHDYIKTPTHVLIKLSN